MFEDSSGEESFEATCSVDHGGIQSCTASASKNSIADDVVGNITPDTKALVSFRESSTTFDEETLMKMTDEEHEFFERYKEGKCFNIYFNFHMIIFLSVYSKPSPTVFIKVHHLFVPTFPC